METFTASGAITHGWELFKKRPWFFIGVTALYCVVQWLIGQIASAVGQGVLSFIIDFGLSALAQLCMISFALKAHDSVDDVSLADAWKPERYIQYLGVYVLMGIAVIGGLILLIVPGIIASLMFIFSEYIVIEKNISSIDAMKESMRITNGHKWDLFVFLLLTILVIVAGIIALGVGIFVAMPVIALATVHAYRVLSVSPGPITLENPVA